MKPKYAIVRVDNKCPEYTEEDFECPFSNDKIECEICRQGRYGDTKEQLIRKVQTSLQLCSKNRVEKCNQFYFVAKEIVEFLGVKE